MADATIISSCPFRISFWIFAPKKQIPLHAILLFPLLLVCYPYSSPLAESNSNINNLYQLLNLFKVLSFSERLGEK